MRDPTLILRDGLRGFRRRPGYTLVAVATLASGLSASIAAFTYVNGFYQPFPGAFAAGLVRVFDAGPDEPYRNLSYLDYLDYAEADLPFESLAATQPFYAASVRFDDATEVAWLEAVSGRYFDVLGVETVRGRGLTEADDRPGAEAAAVLSHAWWQRSFGGRDSVIGQTIYLNFRPFTVVGVASPGFLGTTASVRPQVWIPIAPFRDRYTSWAQRAEDRDVPLVHVYGRLRDGASLRSAGAALAAAARGLDREFPRQDGTPRRTHAAAATWIDPSARIEEGPTLRLMVAAVGVLLVLVCANVANLLLSLGSGRQRELAIRAALGASRLQLFRHALGENLLLSGVAGALALGVAGPLASRLGSYFARPSVWGEHVSREVAVDLRVAAFAAGLSLFTGAVAGLLPALRAARRDVVGALAAESALGAEASGRRCGPRLPGVGDALVAAQIGLSLVLLVVAGLVARTLASVGSLDPGFSYESLVVTHVSTSSTTLEPEEREGFFRELVERLGDEPWVAAATVADYPLLSGHPEMDMRLEGGGSPVPLVYSRVVPGFFEALGIGVVAGRSFVAGDRADAPGVAVVNESLARRFFGGRAVGRRIWWPAGEDRAERRFEVVGVVRDTRTQDYFGDVEPTVYFSYPQHPYPTGSAVIVSARSDPAGTVPVLQRWLRELEPHLAIVNVVTYGEIVSGFLYTHRMNAEMFSLLALLGTSLAAVGVFSVVALAVSRRRREIAIRVAIGARRADVARLVVLRTLGPVAAGLVLGLLGAVTTGRLLGSLLYGVEPMDPATLVSSGAVLALASLAAIAVPVRRAVLVDPLTALRRE